MRKSIKLIARAAHFRRVPCCMNCLFFDEGDVDCGGYAKYEPFCGNPKNEDPNTKGGQKYTFGVGEDTCCDHHKFKSRGK